MFCSSCGKQILGEQANFCSSYGKPVTNQNDVVTSTTSVATNTAILPTNPMVQVGETYQTALAQKGDFYFFLFSTAASATTASDGTRRRKIS